MAPTDLGPTSRLFMPSLEGVRAVACLGIVLAHSAFHTGNDTGALINRMLGRMDLFVPVFFALSGFLLWRRYSMNRGRHQVASYYVKRCGRILPAYLVFVLVMVTLFPATRGAGTVPIIANFLLFQNFVPEGLIPGMTHLWSLCAEMFFYLLMPFIAVAVRDRSRRTRVSVILVIGALSLLWPLIAGPRTGALNPQIMPWAFLMSFCVGLCAAETEGWIQEQKADRVATMRRWAGRRYLWVGSAVGVLIVAAVDIPEGLVAVSPAEFARKTLYGVFFATALVVPLTISPHSRILASLPMQVLGRWSYSIFLWHMAALLLVFPLLGMNPFTGGYVELGVVFTATLALSVPLAALSYGVVEDPSRRVVSRWWSERSFRATGADGAKAVTTTAVRHATKIS